MKTSDEEKLMMWNNNRISSLLIMKHRTNLMKKMTRSSSSSPIFKKRHIKKKKDDDLIGKVRTTTTTTISDLPEELLTEILVRLYVKDVLSCVRVNKSWHSLIKTRKLMINICNNIYQLSPPLPRRYFRFPLVSNGLSCIFHLNGTYTKTPLEIHLWIPVIQKCITLPDSPPHPPSKTSWKAIAFGFVPDINDYLVVVMAKYKHLIVTSSVYSLNTNSWREITHPNTHIGDICRSGGIIVNGIAIWIGYESSHMDEILVCFDTKTGMLRKIASPISVAAKLLGSHPPTIHALDQSIVYLVEKGNFLKEYDMWISKGDPMNKFVWEKKELMIREEKSGRVLCLRNNGEPILRLLPGGRPFIIKPYAESLVLLA